MFLSFALALAGGCATSEKTAGGTISESKESFEEKRGIQVEGIRLSAAGYMLDFRPEDKKQKWENIKNHSLDEYNVCVEHCGNDSNCMSKCEKAYITE